MNQRNFTFRAWDKQKKEWCYGYPEVGGFNLKGETILMGIFGAYPLEYFLENIIVTQFTGLLDKNGKEIYEGDIIKHTRWDRPFSKKQKRVLVLCEVMWHDGKTKSLQKLPNPSVFNTLPQFIASPVNPSAEGSRWGYDWSEFHDCEIVGNQFQNPELLGVSG